MLNRMRIGTMLTLGFGVVILLMALMVVMTNLRVSDFARSIGEINQQIYPNTTAAATIRFNVVTNWANTLMLGTISNKEVVKRFDDEIAASNKIIGFIALVVANGSAVLMVRTVSKQLGGEVFEAGNIARVISEGNL